MRDLVHYEYGSGILDQPLNHKEVQEVADRVKTTFERLVTEIVMQL